MRGGSSAGITRQGLPHAEYSQQLEYCDGKYTSCTSYKFEGLSLTPKLGQEAGPQASVPSTTLLIRYNIVNICPVREFFQWVFHSFLILARSQLNSFRPQTFTLISLTVFMTPCNLAGDSYPVSLVCHANRE